MPTCKTCRFFDRNAELQGGLCRIRAPANILDSSGDINAFWPYVSTDDWCGEHRAPDAPPTELQEAADAT